jgi:hypothetical protein
MMEFNEDLDGEEKGMEKRRKKKMPMYGRVSEDEVDDEHCIECEKAKKEEQSEEVDQQDRRRLTKRADARDGHNIPEDLAIRWSSAIVVPRSRHRLIVCVYCAPC